ncbi:hypothetical protein AURDEDRAFT_151545 [Auricularia subglabra TFB-10046 SS5]|nr:hypothetical protein AURDEDRAFT_151545 [Auricularia subglabra TFB-10046 SS5]
MSETDSAPSALAEAGRAPHAEETLSPSARATRLAGVKAVLGPSLWFSSQLEHAKAVWSTATHTSPPDFLTGDHVLVPQFINHMLALAGATSYDDILATVTFLQGGTRGESPTTTHPPKRPRHTADPTPLPPMATYEWDQERIPDTPASSISSAVDDFLERFEQAISGESGMLHPDAVQNGYFPKGTLWVPEPSDATWTKQQCRRFASMLIPAVPLCDPPRPDLLLYLLGNLETLDPEVTKRLEWLQTCPKACIVNNASGSGKTRLLLEYSCARWTLFFMLSWDPSTNPYGSRDFLDALHMLYDGQRVGPTRGEPFRVNVHPEQPDNPSQAEIDRWQHIWDNNDEIASHIYQLVLLARLLIYQRFRRLVVNHPENDAMRAWCLLQVCPAYSGMRDVFCELLQTLSQLSLSSVQVEIKRLLNDLDLAGQIPSALIFDESQDPAQKLKTAFGPTRGLGGGITSAQRDPPTFDKYRRPLLKPIVNSIRTPFLDYVAKFRTLIAGTKLHHNLVSDALCSSVGKDVSVDDYVEFGAQDSPRRIRAVLQHYLGAQVVSQITVTMWEHLNYWLQGRHRFIAIFVSGVLMSGRHPKQMMNVLSNILKCLTGHALLGRDHHDLPWLRVDTIMPKILKNPGSIDESLRDFLTKSVLEFIIKGKSLKWARDDQDLVASGLARFTVVSRKSGTTVIVNEHLVLVTLFHWCLTGHALLGRDHHDLPWLRVDTIMPKILKNPGSIDESASINL